LFFNGLGIFLDGQQQLESATNGTTDGTTATNAHTNSTMPETTAPEARRVLGLFNKKAEKLNGLQFLAAVRAGKGSYKMRGFGGLLEVTGDFATVDEVDAFVLTLRLFVQNNEPISLYRIGKLYRDTLELTPLAVRIAGLREKVNRFLDAGSPIVWQKEQLPRRRILDVFFYGGLAHTHPGKAKEYSRWMEHEYMAMPFEAEFYNILAAVTQTIFWIRQVNLEALELLEDAA
jgi:hypothetical protein